MSIRSSIDLTKDTTSKLSPWLTKVHIDSINVKNESKYTIFEKQRAERVLQYVTAVFPKNRVFLNYRSKFIAIKVEGISMASASAVQTQMLEDLCDLTNVQVVVNGTNIIFRLS